MSKFRERQRRKARAPSTREPRKRILVFCEGEATEPEYIQGFQHWCRNPLVVLVVDKERGVPRTLVANAKQRKEEAEEEARRSKDEFLRYDEVWCVYDVDEHPGHNDAWQMARDNGINLAISNPCFEFWLLLHIGDNPGPQDRGVMQKKLAAALGTAGKHIDFAQHFAAGYERAVHLAKASRKATGEQPPHLNACNPTTTVHCLTESIRTGSRS